MYWLYDRILSAYEEQKTAIPKGDLIEVEYKDLVNDPLNQIAKVYKTLGIKGFETAKTDLIAYIDTQRFYKPNTEQFLKKKTQ